jgi:hypothetical protein
MRASKQNERRRQAGNRYMAHVPSLTRWAPVSGRSTKIGRRPHVSAASGPARTVQPDRNLTATRPTQICSAGGPWVPFTRAGCDVGAFSVANIELENVTSDIDNVFGPTSPEHNEAATNRTLAIAGFEGITSTDTGYATVNAALQDLTAARDAIAGVMISILEGAAFGNERVDEEQANQLIHAAEDLLQRAR